MEDFLLVLLILGFVWVLVRQSQFNNRLRHLNELYERLLRAQPQMPLQPQAPSQPLGQAPAQTSPRPAAVVPAPPPAPPVAMPPAVLPVAAQQAAPSTAAPYTYKAAYIPAPPAPAAAPQATTLPPTAPTAPKPHVSLEARLGQNWLNKLGIGAMVVGIALLLSYQVHNLGPVGKSLVGLVIALGILGLGVFLERKPNYRIFARACIGGGWALLFFLSFAIYHLPLLQVLHSSVVDLVLMLLVASGMVAHSLRYRSQTVTTIAFFLAFLTVGISDVTVFSLVAGTLLAAALAVIVYRERWFLLGLAGVFGVYINHFLWLHRVLPDGGTAYLRQNGHAFPEFTASAALLLAYWLIFRIVYVFRAPLEGNDYREQQGYASFAAILNSVGLLSLLKYQSSHPEWAFWALLALGIVELTLSLIARGTITFNEKEAPRNRPAFIILSTIASVVLLAAVPFRFHGASWSLLWLLEAEAFFLAGVRLPEVVFRRLGILANFVTAAWLVLNGLALVAVDSGSTAVTLYATPHHPALVLFTAALVMWLNAELATRLTPFIAGAEFDRLALTAASYVATLLAALGIAIAFHGSYAWIAVAWLVLSLILGDIADRLRSQQLATQADLLALAAVIRTVTINLQIDPRTVYSLFGIHVSLQLLTIGVTALLLYAAVRRKLGSYILFVKFIAPAYTWVAGALVATLCWYQLEPISVAVAWGVFALVLFELGATFRKDYLRQQAYLLLVATFARIFFANLQVPGTSGTLSPSLYTVLPLIAAFAWVYERTQSLEASSQSRLDALAGTVFAWCGLIVTGTLLYFEVRPDWVILAWTPLAIALLALAAGMKRSLFVAQSLVVVAAVAIRGIAFHLFSPTALATSFTTSRWFTIGLTSALLLMALPIAFHLRRYYSASVRDFSSPPEAHSAEVKRPASPNYLGILHHPEQPFFFTPLALLALLLYVQLTGGVITIGWVALGLAAFLFALTVKERSFRLSGLGLLMLGVAKVLLWDVWHAPPAERYLTLIIMGAALLLVSFLYSRYRETLLKFL
jgi:hypothetical protein